jgi:hypothetical protein
MMLKERAMGVNGKSAKETGKLNVDKSVFLD